MQQIIKQWALAAARDPMVKISPEKAREGGLAHTECVFALSLRKAESSHFCIGAALGENLFFLKHAPMIPLLGRLRQEAKPGAQ